MASTGSRKCSRSSRPTEPCQLSTGPQQRGRESGTLTGMVEPSRLATAVGLYSILELESRGVDRRGRDRLVRQGRLVPAARGWFATAEPDRSALSAIRAGVRLTCVSAARFHGLWTPATPGMHAYGRRGAALPGFIAHSPYLDGWPETGRGEPEPVPAPCGQVSEQRVRRHPVRVGTDHRPALRPGGGRDHSDIPAAGADRTRAAHRAQRVRFRDAGGAMATRTRSPAATPRHLRPPRPAK